MDYPLVSIITPVLNGIKYLEPCIKSTLDQSYPSIEHVFADGGSTDGTVEMLLKYKAEHPEKITLIFGPDTVPGRGSGEAWNKGLKMAKGEIFGWLGSDDMYEPDTIGTVVEFFKSNPDAFFVHGGCNYINENEEVFYTHHANDVILDKLINENNFISCPSAFYRRTVVEKTGEIDDYGNDYDYFIRIAKRYPIHRIDKVLSKFRVRNESETGNLESYIKVLKKDYIVSRKHGGIFFSKFGRRYFKHKIIEKLGLIPFYSFLKNRKRHG